jgi:hypothetical protein
LSQNSNQRPNHVTTRTEDEVIAVSPELVQNITNEANSHHNSQGSLHQDSSESAEENVISYSNHASGDDEEESKSRSNEIAEDEEETFSVVPTPDVHSSHSENDIEEMGQQAQEEMPFMQEDIQEES